MWALLIATATAGPDIDAFGKSLEKAVEDGDESFLRAFMDDMLAELSEEHAARELETANRLLTGWVERGLAWECRKRYCQMSAGGRPVGFVKPAPEGSAVPFVFHNHGRQRDRFDQHYTLSITTTAPVEVEVGGERMFLLDRLESGTESVSFVNDYLVIGENTVTVQPVSKPAKVTVRVGGHPTWHPSPDKESGSVVTFDGKLKDAQTWTFTAEPASDEPFTWPTDIVAHLQSGVNAWLSGGDQRVLEPWPAWLDDEVRDALKAAGVVELEPVMFQLDLNLGPETHLSGYFVPGDTPAWVITRVDDRVMEGAYPVIEGPWTVWSDPVEALMADLRADDCPPVKRRVPSAAIFEKLPSDRYQKPFETDTSAEALQRACEVARGLPEDAAIAYMYDEIVYVGRNAAGKPVVSVNGELSYRTASPFILSLLKDPQPL